MIGCMLKHFLNLNGLHQVGGLGGSKSKLIYFAFLFVLLHFAFLHVVSSILLSLFLINTACLNFVINPIAV